MEQQLARRRFLQLGGATAAVLTASATTAWASPTPPPARLTDGVFTLGVASGDPLHNRVVIWTRLAAEPVALDGAGGMPARPVAVSWEVAHDDRFARLVRRGMTMARREDGHTVHVDVDGLEPARWYYYRFRAEGQLSPVGRTRTAPAPGDLPSSWRFAVASCQNYTAGYYTAYQDMLAGDPDIVLHLGDYIYESAAQGNLGRGHLPNAKLATLADYRVRLAQYRTDPDLQAVHSAVPFAITWDDHEVENNWAGDDADPDRPPAEFAALKTAAFQAYWEHMPFRAAQRPSGPSMRMYRRLHWGRLATINMLDTRQYRSDHVPDIEADGPEAWDPDPDNPHFRMAGNGRGHVAIEVTPQLARADFRVVDTVRQQTSAAGTIACYVVEDGRPGLSRG